MLSFRQIELVEHSWDLALHHATEVGEIFYAKLFQADPALRFLFKGDVKVQAEKLTTMITFAVHKLKNMTARAVDGKVLETKHHEQAQPHHYPLAAATLLWTLEKILKDYWTEEVKEAWAASYNRLADIMIKASQAEPCL